MQSSIRLPEYFKEYNKQSLYSNLASTLNEEVAKAILNKPFFSRYSAWNFNGLVWWNDLGYWCIEIWQDKEYKISYMCETLPELINEVSDAHGAD